MSTRDDMGMLTWGRRVESIEGKKSMRETGTLARISALTGVAGAGAAVVFGYLAFADDRLPRSAGEAVATLKEIRDLIENGRIAMDDAREQSELIEAAGATAETVYRLATERGAKDLPLLRVTERPAMVKLGESAEYLLPNGRHVVIGVSLQNGEPYVTVNGSGAFLRPGAVVTIPHVPECHVALIGYDAETRTGNVRPTCRPGS